MKSTTIFSAGYDQWIELFRGGLTAMRERACCGPTPTLATWRYRWSPRTRAARLITHATGDAEPLRAALAAAVDYVRSFATRPKARTRRSSPRRAKS